ncbi:MAG: helix-turn-helix domain-containing protein [Fusobacterium ulcerans]|uniref:helix-turn-helix domain-containing protein n=1 Tax=Fusobacterium ulcerans TaxID=861 RepID=UPI003A89E57A
MQLGERLLQLRTTSKVSREELANVLKVSNAMISYYEKGKRALSIEKLKEIADYFSFPMFLFFVDDEIFTKALTSQNFELSDVEYKVPIISKASAGKGAFAREEVIDYIKLPKQIFSKCDFATLVQGDSMSPKIEDGEIAFVRKGDFLETGNIGIFYLNEEVFIKKFFLDSLTYTIKLVSINHNYQDIFIKEDDDFRIIGRVIGTLNYHL